MGAFYSVNAAVGERNSNNIPNVSPNIIPWLLQNSNEDLKSGLMECGKSIWEA
jgi:hypothetical protein